MWSDVVSLSGSNVLFTALVVLDGRRGVVRRNKLYEDPEVLLRTVMSFRTSWKRKDITLLQSEGSGLVSGFGLGSGFGLV